MTDSQKNLQACAVLALLLIALFFPFVIGSKSLMLSGWDAPSIMSYGAYSETPPPPRIGRTPDPGAPAWATEPWLKLMQRQFWSEFTVPLWNPYNAYGTPLAAAMQPQPYYPLTVLTTLHVSPWTYNLFLVARLLVAGVLTFFFARLFLTALPSTVAAVTFMLTGYFTIYLNMPHVSAEVLTPGMFLALEMLLRRKSWNAVAFVAAMVVLSIVGGMPESTFLTLSFSCTYFASRLIFNREFRDASATSLGRFVVAIVLGFALSATLLLPFVEFLGVAHDVHQPGNVGGTKAGLIADSNITAVIFYLLPLIFGPVNNSIFSNFSGWAGLKSYWGIVPCVLASASVLTIFANSARDGRRDTRFITAFFAIALALMLMKRFGSPVINWIGSLPVSEMVLYVKYQEPLMAFCVAILAGVGVGHLIEGRLRTMTLVAAAAIVLSVAFAVVSAYAPKALQLSRYGYFFHISVAAGMFYLLAAAALMLWHIRARSQQLKDLLARGLFGLLCLELTTNYVVPAYYIYGVNPPTARSPYDGAPYLLFLKQRNADHARIFGRESLLYPNWSAAFGLSEVRALDAMYDRRYIAFIRNFLLDRTGQRRHGDLADRFTGAGFPYDFENDLKKRFLALSSIRYLISSSEYEGSTVVLDAILAQHQGKNIWGFGTDVFRIGGNERPAVRGLFQHPPSSRIPFRVTINPQTPIFDATAVLKAEVYDRSDGAGFKIEVKDGDAIVELFSTTLNPRDIASDRAGRATSIDLSRYVGREIELLFSTDPGPAGSNAFDWAGWTGLRFVQGGIRQPSTFTEIYGQEVRIYEYAKPLPRAALFSSIEILPDSVVLERLRDPTFMADEKVVLSRETIPDSDLATLQPLATSKPASPTAARIVRYQTQRVTIETYAPAPSVLVLTDTNYPGWRATLNGQRVPIKTANYLFRSVVVPAGKNTVEFAYEPDSFRIGAAISFAALMALCGLVWFSRRTRASAAPTR